MSNISQIKSADFITKLGHLLLIWIGTHIKLLKDTCRENVTKHIRHIFPDFLIQIVVMVLKNSGHTLGLKEMSKVVFLLWKKIIKCLQISQPKLIF